MVARKSSDNFTAAEKRQLWDRESGVCQYCHSDIPGPKKANFHHILPRANGGEVHSMINGALLHQSCHVKHYDLLHPGLAHRRAIMSGRGYAWWLYKRFQVQNNPQIRPLGCKDSTVLCEAQQAIRSIVTTELLEEAGCGHCTLGVRHRNNFIWLLHNNHNMALKIEEIIPDAESLIPAVREWLKSCHQDGQ
jgi:hypothetical protein